MINDIKQLINNIEYSIKSDKRFEDNNELKFKSSLKKILKKKKK